MNTQNTLTIKCSKCKRDFTFEKKRNWKLRKVCHKCRHYYHYPPKFQCKLCGTNKDIHTHHILGKSNDNPKYLIGLCKYCHKFISAYHQILKYKGIGLIENGN